MNLGAKYFWMSAVLTVFGLDAHAQNQAPAIPLHQILAQRTGPNNQRPTLTESLKAWDTVQVEIGKAIANADEPVKTKAGEIPTLPTPATPQAEPITADQRNFLLGKIKDFAGYTKSEDSQFTFWAVTCIIVSGFLALAGAILSFLKKNVLGGIAGIIVTAIVGLSNAYPLNALANFYRGLESQASALEVECELKQPFTSDSYNSAANQLKLLYLYESKRPGFGNFNAPIQSLSTDLQTVKTSSDTVEKTRGTT